MTETAKTLRNYRTLEFQFAALPGSLVAAPFSLILLGALTTQIGTLQTAPVAIAVITAYLAISGSGVLVTLARRQTKPSTANA